MKVTAFMTIYNILEKDWKLYRNRIGGWQERHMERLVKDYVELLNKPGLASDNFWELEKRIREDKNSPGVMSDKKRSTAVWEIASLLAHGIITADDLDGFSDDLKESVRVIARMSA